MWVMVLRLLSKCLAKHGGAQPCSHGLDIYQKHNVGNVGNVGHGFEVAKTPRTMHGHILTVIPYNYIYDFTNFNNLMTHIAYKASKAPSLLVKTVGSLTLKHCPQSNPHRPHLLRVCPYEIILDNCKAIPYINITGRDIATRQSTKRK
jgi:hypothetical protein